jgi:PAS domain-containing protein
MQRKLYLAVASIQHHIAQNITTKISARLRVFLRMGNGAAVHDTGYLFANEDVRIGSQKLKDVGPLRSSFVGFVKSGVWIDQIAQPLETSLLTHEDRLAKEKGNIVYEYKIATGKLCEIEALASKSFSARDSTQSQQGTHSIGESYVNIVDDCKCLTTSEHWMSLLLNILFPVYMTSKAHSLYLRKHQAETSENRTETVTGGISASTDTNEDDYNGAVDYSGKTTKYSKRAQDILLGCAAYFDEATLLSELEKASWHKGIQQALDSYPLGITVVNISDENLPIVYSNDAYLKLSGYTDQRYVLGKGVHVLLNGAETDAGLAEHLEQTYRKGIHTKVAIMHHNKAGQSFLHMIATNPVRPPSQPLAAGASFSCPTESEKKKQEGQQVKSPSYVVAVHVNGSKLQNLDDLKVSVVFSSRFIFYMRKLHRLAC